MKELVFNNNPFMYNFQINVIVDCTCVTRYLHDTDNF